MAFYSSFSIALLLPAMTAPAALALGFGGAMVARSRALPLRMLGRDYIALVRGQLDIV